MPATFDDLAARFDGPGVRAVVLVGSYASGNAGPLSDVDLIHFTDGLAAPAGAGSHLIDDRLVVVSDVDPAGVVEAFSRPQIAVGSIEGLRRGHALIDRDACFASTAFANENEEGIAPPLREQVTAGLRLYVVTAGLLAPVL